MPTFRNTLFHLHRQVDVSRMKLGIRNYPEESIQRCICVYISIRNFLKPTHFCVMTVNNNLNEVDN